jgi:transposase-like protein
LSKRNLDRDRMIRQRYEAGTSTAQLAEMYGIGQRGILDAVKRARLFEPLPPEMAVVKAGAETRAEIQQAKQEAASAPPYRRVIIF